MKTQEHTAGPWHSELHRAWHVYGPYPSAPNEAEHVAILNCTERAEANAHLVAAAPQLLEALELLRKAVIGVIWEPLGSTGDESDWFCCQLCGAKSRGTTSLAHRKDCPMEIAKAAIRSAKGETL